MDEDFDVCVCDLCTEDLDDEDYCFDCGETLDNCWCEDEDLI